MDCMYITCTYVVGVLVDGRWWWATDGGDDGNGGVAASAFGKDAGGKARVVASVVSPLPA